MKVTINDEEHELPPETVLTAALSALGIAETRGVALARNGAVVPRDRWDDESLAEGDRVVVIRAAQGG